MNICIYIQEKIDFTHRLKFITSYFGRLEKSARCADYFLNILMIDHKDNFMSSHKLLEFEMPWFIIIFGDLKV